MQNQEIDLDVLEEEFDEMLIEYSRALGKTSASSIKSYLQKWWDEKAGQGGSVPSLVRYDVSAFMFHYADDDKDEFYFRPMASFRYDDGTQVDLPDIKQVDTDEIEHWSSRSNEIDHSLMKARYADLVWELTQEITGRKPDVLFARRAIEAYLESVERELYDETLYAIHYCERALCLALSISDEGLIQRSKECIFALYEKAVEYDKIGLWAFLYDDLVDNPKVKLTAVETEKIISELNTILDNFTTVTDGKCPDPFVAEAAAERLAKHYNRAGDVEKAKEAIRKSGTYFEQISTGASSLLAVGWLESVLNIYDKMGMVEDRRRVLREIKERGKTVKGEMKEISGEVKISQEDITKLIEHVCSGTPEEALFKLIQQFMPSTEHAKSMREYVKKNCVFLSLLSTSVIRDGNIEARIGSVEEDEIGHTIQHMGQELLINSGLIALLLREMNERKVLDLDRIVDFIGKSELLGGEGTEIIREGIAAHWKGVYISSVHVLIPQIERMVRNLAISIGVVTSKYNRRDRTTQEKTLSDLLNDEIFRQTAPEELRLYLQCLLVDKRGLNIRNNVAHGLLTAEAFSEQLAAQLIYCLLLCSILRIERKPVIEKE